MSQDLDQILLLLVGVFGLFSVMLVVLARIEARLGDPPTQRSSAPPRWGSHARQAGRDTRAGGPPGK